MRRTFERWSVPLAVVIGLLVGCTDEKAKETCVGTPEQCSTYRRTGTTDVVAHEDPGPAVISDSGTSKPETSSTPGGYCSEGADKVCDGIPPAEGPNCKFGGFSVTPDSPKSSGQTWDFSCTTCPGGKIPQMTNMDFNGVYKYYEWGDEGPRVQTPDPAEYRETLEFNGNYFTNVIEGIDSWDNQYKKVTAKGYFFCPLEDELKHSMAWSSWWNMVIVYAEVEPNGAFGIEAGAADLCYLLVSSSPQLGSSDIQITCNQFWDPEGTYQNQHHYCRVGKKIDGRVCEDPFTR